jgi:hypothetical protein
MAAPMQAARTAAKPQETGFAQECVVVGRSGTN